MTKRPWAGSLRERRPGTWELRVALGPHEVSGRSLVRSVTVHGDRDDATAALARWAATAQMDLDGDVLTISCGTSREVVGPTKTGRIRRLTLGGTTADL